jgi:D-serine dehydratase
MPPDRLSALLDPAFLAGLSAQDETLWIPPQSPPTEARALFGQDDIAQASARLQRFAPYLAQVFPETAPNQGLIESPLIAATSLPGRQWLKTDNALPVAGSIKARGGIHEVLKVAEDIALKHQLITPDSDRRALATPEARTIFSSYSLAVGSTGNLGLSIGIMGAKLGLAVTVHMSADAKGWKKDLLRRHGVRVIEHQSDYGAAVAQGRAAAEADPTCHFVDDERSADLFLGYAVAAERLQAQLQAEGIAVDQDHPLCVSLPCGVGGAPGGVAFGLKTIFGSAVHCLFAEPTAAPCMLLGISSGLHDGISVQDIGLSGLTCADGLAVGRPSALVGRLMAPLLSGLYSVRDETMLRWVAQLYEQEGLFVEPSAAAALPSYGWITGPQGAAFRARHGLDAATLARTTHIAWLTGGSFVPEDERAALLAQGRRLLAESPI